MRPIFLLALTFAVAAPICAQTAPAGWTSQTRAGDVQVFTPPDLGAGEVYSVSVYPAAPSNGQSLEDWLRDFGGPVADKPGALIRPMTISAGSDGRNAIGTGVYGGPNGTGLGASFIAVSLDGESVRAMRTLFSHPDLLARYQAFNTAITEELVKTALDQNRLYVALPADIQLKRGGALVPGVYAGTRTREGKVLSRYRVYLYANGEHRVTDANDADIKGSYGTILGVGTYQYNAGSGRLQIEGTMGLGNDSGPAAYDYCFYGRDANGKAVIVAGNTILNERTLLVYDGQPTKRPSPTTMKARAIEDARFKWVTAPGKGVGAAQIAAIVNDYRVNFDGMSTRTTNEAYLLLKDGTVYNGLPVAPDQLDIAKSRAGEPAKWGKWRAKGEGYEVSWNGKPYESLAGDKVLPAAPNAKLSGRFGGVSSSSYDFGGSYAFWGVTFTPDGRFRKDSRGGSSTNSANIEGMATVTSGYDEGGSAVVGQSGGVGIASVKTKTPGGDRAGTYSLSGYTLTLRYDNGAVVRMPFFFNGAKKRKIWFEGDILSLDITD